MNRTLLRTMGTIWPSRSDGRNVTVPVPAAKVVPGAAPVSAPKFKKPIAKMRPPLTEFDPAYLKRKVEVPAQIFSLKSGKQVTDCACKPWIL